MYFFCLNMIKYEEIKLKICLSLHNHLKSVSKIDCPFLSFLGLVGEVTEVVVSEDLSMSINSWCSGSVTLGLLLGTDDSMSSGFLLKEDFNFDRLIVILILFC